MSALLDDLRNNESAHTLIGLAADEIEDLEKAYALLFKEKGEMQRQRDEAREEGELLRSLLASLYAMVLGECPSLLNEDSGGSAHLAIDIEAAMKGSK